MHLFKKTLNLALSAATLIAALGSQSTFAMKSLHDGSYRIPFVNHSEMHETEFTEINRLAYQTATETFDILQRIDTVQSKTSFREMSQLNWDIIIQKMRYARDMFSIGLIIPTQNYVYYDNPATIFTDRTKLKILEVVELSHSIILCLDRKLSAAYKYSMPMQVATSSVMEIHRTCGDVLKGLLELSEITHIPIPKHIKVRTVL